jgi:TolB-like protein
MASLIPGFEYDIFISYRQKDNKHDGWVSRFVENLKGELESTFKEDISIYFDENPQDRLQETHNVDKSLAGKLRCLIFMPILSQTYCDPNSYAWQYEFMAFLKMAEADQFGKDIKLRSGNVAGRILPVRIHDLEPEDVKLYEKESGNVLRAMDFVFKTSTGVNRPLKVNEDHPNDNLNKTFYGDQINKVANAIKEIILALKSEKNPNIEVKDKPSKDVAEDEGRKEKRSNIKVGIKIRTILILMLVLIICLAGVFITYKMTGNFNRSDNIEGIEKSIAVLPFINDTPGASEENTPFFNGLMEEIIISLQTIRDFRVPGRTSVEKFRNNSTKSISEIADELDVNFVVEGSGQRYGNTLRLRVQLIRARSRETHLWAKSYEQVINDTKDIFTMQSQIAEEIAAELKAVITPQEKQRIEKTPTANLGSYDAYLKGLFFYEKQNLIDNDKAILKFKESIKLDSSFALPWTYLSMCYWRQANRADQPEFKESKRTAEHALQLDPRSAISIVNIAEILDNEYDFEGAENKLKLALKIEPDNQYVLRNAGRFYTLLGKGEESISFCLRALKNDPYNSTALFYLAKAYFYSGHITEAWATFIKYKDLEYPGLQTLYYQLLLEEGKFDRIIHEAPFEGDENLHNMAVAAANFATGKQDVAEKICEKLKKNNYPAYWMAFIYAYGGNSLKVSEWLEKSYNLKEKELSFLYAEPAFKKYRNEKRVKELIQKMKFPV